MSGKKAKQRNPRRREEGKNGNLEKGFVGVKGLSQGHKAQEISTANNSHQTVVL